MKFSLILLLLLSFPALSQEVKSARFEALQKAGQGPRETGLITLQLPNDIPANVITEKAANYTQFFSVELNERKHQVLITMKENTAGNRRVIKRFLIALEIKQVEVDQQKITVDEFYTTYLN